MPELPEVETIARGVNKRLRGDRIVQAWFGSRPQSFKSPPARQARGLAGCAILDVHRTGKHIVFELGAETHGIRQQNARNSFPPLPAKNVGKGGAPTSLSPLVTSVAQWIVHLGMTGRLLVTTQDSPLAPHTHARLDLASGRELRFVDPRRFGRLEFRDLRDGAAAFQAPGAEPLTIGARQFAELFHQRRTPIKAALLNQSLLSGVGNIYADESLFAAGIGPRRRSNRLTAAELERLRMELRRILNHAIRLGGSSVSDYVDADGERGFFQLEHCVYQRTGEPCRRCQTPIRRIELAGRGTHYCPNCQR
ncbi:MAG: bifunctional DNA-formamidopyrimidine glycosylase/DNA-(apurinic or apyrimidinic site) lyase [Terracidiphilus sp.]